MSPNGEGTAILRDDPSHAKVEEDSTFISQLFLKTLSIGPVPGMEPATSGSAVKHTLNLIFCVYSGPFHTDPDIL